MRRSTERILTTHTGSLPREPGIEVLLREREEGRAVDAARFEAAAREAVGAVVARQLETGLDVVNDGEQAKPSYVTYLIDRVAGFGGERRARFPKRRDSQAFPDWSRASAPRGLAALRVPTCDAPLVWKDFGAVERDLARLADAARAGGAQECFVSAASPGVVSVMLANAYYPSREAYLEALGDVMKREYEAIVAAGFVLQVDCPDLAMSWNSEFSELSLAEFKKTITMHVAVLDGALADVDPERVRMHLCWGNYEGPHSHDVPLREIAPIVLRARPRAIALEGANPRHAHEWAVWRELPLPDEKVLIPGCIDTTTNFVEHPELVAQRIVRYAEVVGRERVMAGTDCGFGTMPSLPGVARSVAWAKLGTLVEGARIASERLF